MFCGPSMVFTNVVNPRAFIERKHEFQPILVKRGATLGANSTVLCGVTIGQYALVGAGSVVTHDVPAVRRRLRGAGPPAGWVSEEGHPLQSAGSNAFRCPRTGKRYRLCDGTLAPVD